MRIRHSESRDDDAIWRILESTFRAGETYPIPRDISRSDALAYWHSPGHTVFVAEDAGTIIGTYYLRANNRGGGAHVANYGYVVAPDAFGRGVARAHVRAFARPGADAKIHHDAVQFRYRFERAGGAIVAEPGVCLLLELCREPSSTRG